jgi:NADH-quinone oxidoreductase subunit N
MNGVLGAAQALDVARYYAGGWALLPEYLIGVGAATVLVVDAFRTGPGGGRRTAQLAMAFLALALIASITAAGESRTLFSGMVVIDPFARFFRVLFTVAGLLGVVLSMQSDEVSEKNAGEYYSMLLGLVMGMMLLAESSDIIMIYLSLELVSLMSYVLAGFRRHDRKSAEAALKYVIYGGAASGAMLFGLSLIYGLTQETQLSMIHQAVVQMARDAAVGSLAQGGAPSMPAALSVGLVLTFVGFAYKIAAVPLHMWSPDVYEGAPTPFTAFLSTGPKAAGFAAVVRFFIVAFSDPSHSEGRLFQEASTLPWIMLIIVVSTLTMILGNLAAIGQNNIKRFLAYSSIAHAGYTLVGLAAFSDAGAAAVLLYMAFYLAMNIGAFYAVIWVRDQLGSELISDYKGLGHRAPFIGVTLAVFLFSLTGLPPLAGFIGKYYLFAAVLERGVHAMPVAECAPALKATMGIVGRMSCAVSGGGIYYALALIGVLNSAVSLYYYARVVRSMFLEQPEDPTPIDAELPAKLILAPLAGFLLISGLFFSPIAGAARDAIHFQRPTMAEIQGAPTPTTAAAPRESSDVKDATVSR